MHNRKNSFIVIDIYSKMELDNIKYVKTLKLNKSIYQALVDVLYFYITCYFTIVKTYCKKFYEYKYLEIRNSKNKIEFSRNYTNDLIINDTSISIFIGNNSLDIPYENITQFKINNKNNMLELFILGKINISDTDYTLETNCEICKIYLIINDNNLLYSTVTDCFNNIKKYLYYHIKYNEFDYNILDYYNKLNKNRLPNKKIKS